MTDQEVQLFLADLAIIILLARLLGMAAKRLGQPPVLGEIIAGILLGPTLFQGQITATLFPATIRPALSALANLGVVIFMFAVGYELDLRLFRGRERVAASVSVCSVVLPLALGAGLGVWLAGRHHVHDVLPFALFVGTAMSVTAFPVLARILTDRGMHRTRIGGVALASAAMDDVLAWSLLIVVVAIAGAGGQQFRLLLAPVYAGVMFGVARPLLRRLVGVYQRQGRLTPNVLVTVLAGLLLSSYATDWMGVKYIFGAFIFGVVMPREGAAAALREEILGRLEQVSVLVLLPVFFVVSGLSVDLSSVGLASLLELGLILLVAIAGKFGGAFAGARIAKVRGRRAGVLATLMNTRGLTGIVIVTVGLQLHILDQSLYSLMIVMAIVTTAMAGPLLHFIYPERFVRRDIAEADRVALGTAAGHRILVLIETPETAAPLVEIGAALAASRERSELIL
ncbi:MAG TPA: cation:proton antiporter, partial [Streptosporangiaceae bacterium]